VIIAAISISALSMSINGYVLYCNWRRARRRKAAQAASGTTPLGPVYSINARWFWLRGR
jgi:hypothetical protein